MFKLAVILLSIVCATPLYARDTRGPQQFTVTHPDGSMDIGQYTPGTGQVVIQSPQGTTVMQHQPGNNWQVSIEPTPPACDSPTYGYNYGSAYGGDD